ncbi:tudor and KH domain-containing protein homolog isoform X2 [Penaeus japonicus]|uniref:tudor and KH domain-containing protein homolog isoform X2 n=1 Tax=Penaeus japonicus TaxID=27405 RepID=UPI001C71312B|nr:tudor and KH domain-containing protein homolog isoform X2 [Penaeus japonicus]
MDPSRLKNFILPLGGALLLSGVAGTIYYYLTKKDEEDDRILPDTRNSQWTSAEVHVPTECVGLVIGRQGANIKLIQERTSTKINFADEEVNGHRICLIRGLEENVTIAQKLVIKAVSDQPVIESSEMFVPQYAVGRIIGRNGENIRSVSRITGAKVDVEREDEQAQLTRNQDLRRIVLKGSKEQIDAAKSLLLEKVAEEEEMRQQIQASAVNMSMRARGRQAPLENGGSEASMNGSMHQESLSMPGSDRFIEAYVSAVDSAAHFWLQVVGPRSIQLDKLVTQMTEYYEDEDNRELHELEKVKTGDIVAAKFPHDDSWYRGQVCSYEPNEDDSSQSLVTVYYVDFGDTETIKMDCVFELRTDYLKLNFQAIECFLANIKPESVKGDEAADAFEELTYAAQWKVVMVKVVGYQQGGDKTMPCVRIIDTNGPADIDVAEELVKRGLAEWTNGGSSTP